MPNEALLAVPPQELASARRVSHAAVQWASRAARANLTPAADDSHSNLGWEDAHRAFVSRPLDADGQLQLGFGFSPGAVLWLRDGAVVDSFPIAGSDDVQAGAWCDARLAEAGLKPTGDAEMPYTLDPVDPTDFVDAGPALETLAAWYAEAQVQFDALVEEFGLISIVPPAVRCWPHHYDLGLLLLMDEGDPETARSIGVGMSPGDGSYAEPYFYCTPWPVPSALPEAPAGPMQWHTEGFTSLVCPASRVEGDTDLSSVLDAAVRTSHDLLV